MKASADLGLGVGPRTGEGGGAAPRVKGACPAAAGAGGAAASPLRSAAAHSRRCGRTSPLTAAARCSAAPRRLLLLLLPRLPRLPRLRLRRRSTPGSCILAGRVRAPRPRPRHGVLDHLPPGGVSAAGGPRGTAARGAPLRASNRSHLGTRRPCLGSPETWGCGTQDGVGGTLRSLAGPAPHPFYF